MKKLITTFLIIATKTLRHQEYDTMFSLAKAQSSQRLIHNLLNTIKNKYCYNYYQSVFPRTVVIL